MYGMINRGIRDLVVSTAGEESWDQIKLDAEVDVPGFVNSELYDDEITFRLVESASKYFDEPAENILRSFGRHWILFTSQEEWDTVFQLGGSTLIEFLTGLDAMHSRVQVALPNANMPQFSVAEMENHLQLTYRSTRVGLAAMVLGLLDGLAERFNESWTFEHLIEHSTPGCEIFALKNEDLSNTNSDKRDVA